MIRRTEDVGGRLHAGRTRANNCSQSEHWPGAGLYFVLSSAEYYSSPIVHGAHWIVPVVGSSVEVLFSTSPTSIAGEAWMTVANSFLSTE